MIADRLRMDAYASAVRAVVKPGDVVVDVGTGTGVLAFMACDAGARHVYAIEQKHVADMAMLLVRHRGLSDRVTVFHEHSSKVDLPEPADVILTETIACLGFEEGLLTSVIDARRRLARPGAAVIPGQIALSIVPVEWPAFYAKHIDWWSDSPLRTFTANTAWVDAIDARAHLAPPQRLMDVDLTTIEELTVAGSASFTATRDGVMHGFAGWFAATLAPGITLSNETPRATHWDHAFLPLEQPIPIRAATRIEVTLEYYGGQEWRWRGTIDGTAFDQTTFLNTPPCAKTAVT